MPHTVISLPANQSQDLAQWLRWQIQQDGAVQSRLFALLDVAKLKPDALADQGPTPLPAPLAEGINLYGDLQGTALAGIGPRLFSVDDSRLETWANLAGQTSAVSFIACADLERTLADHLQSLREVELPDGAQALLRFQDAYVAAHLWPLLMAGQGNQILGPADWWAVPDACGIWHLLTPAMGHQRMVPLRFERKQYDRLNEQMLVYSIAEQVREVDTQLLHGLNVCQATAMLRTRLKAACDLGLTLQSDKALYVVLSLQLPTGFEQEAPFAEALERHRRGMQSFGDALDHVPADQWRRWNDKLD